MKINLYLLLFLSFSHFSFSQKKENTSDKYRFDIKSESIKGRKEFRPSEGGCAFVIELLRASQENDSLALTIFKDEYEIVNMRYPDKNWLFKQDYTKIIAFFSLKKNEKYYCRSKQLKYFGPVLLVD